MAAAASCTAALCFFQAEDGIRDLTVTGVQTCALPICSPNQLYLNKGDGTFEDVSEAWGLRKHIGKGMGVGVADYDLDGRPDLFVSNDLYRSEERRVGKECRSRWSPYH